MNKKPEQIVLSLVPFTVSSELAKLSQAILPPDMFTKLKGNKENLYVKVKDFILTCNKSSDIPQGKIGFGKRALAYLNLNLTDQIAVAVYEIPLDQETTLSYLEFEGYLQNPQPTYYEVDDEEITNLLKKQYTNTFFKPRQIFYLVHDLQLLVLTVTKVEMMQSGSKMMKIANEGRLIAMTDVKYTAKPGDKLKLKNDQSGGASLFRPDFKISDMGIGGLDEELTNIFRRAFASRRFNASTIQKFGIKHVKGILLYGPPGTGKTLIARKLAQVLKAKELTIVNGPEIFSRYVGQSEENIRKLFKKAREDEQSLGDQSPLHIIVFDEIDAICKQRGSGNSGSNAPDLVVNQLLTNIDGVEALNNIIVIGMTNRKDLIDEAILRPGRFQVHIEVGLPSTDGRQQILKIHTKSLSNNGILDSSVNLEKLAECTKNYTGAQIQALVKSATSFTMSRNYDIMDFTHEIVPKEDVKVTMEDFSKALVEVRPQFGVDEEKFEVLLRGRLYDYGKRYYKIMHTLEDAVEITRNNVNSTLNSIILCGSGGTGKTSIAAYFAKKCSFPYVKLISPDNFLGYTDAGKISAIKKIFDDAYRSKQACIILDNIERMIDFVDIGPRFSNHLLQTLLVLSRQLPKKAECRLLLIATTSMYDKLTPLELPQCFNTRVPVPILDQDEMYKILTEDFKVNQAEANQVVKTIIKNCPMQKFIRIKDMAIGKGLKAWQDAYEACCDMSI